MCDCGTHVSGLELEIPRRGPIHPRSLDALVLGGAARLVVIGIAIGMPAAWAAARWAESMLFGLKATDPAAIGGAIVLLVAAAQLAAYLPARRASHVNPLEALRHG